MRKYIIFTLLMVGVILYTSNAGAITVGPSRLEVRLPAGETASADYYVQNETESTIHVSVEPEHWFLENYDYKDLKVSDWIKVDKPEFDLKPSEIKKVVVRIKVPKGRTGELAAQIFFASQIPAADVGTGGSMRSRLGTAFYLAIKGTEKASSQINKIDVTNQTSSDGERLKFDVTLLNEGNVHIRPTSGQILLDNQRGERLPAIDFNVERVTLPGKEAVYTAVSGPGSIKEGKYGVSAIIKYGKMYGRGKETKMKISIEVDKDGKVTIK